MSMVIRIVAAYGGRAERLRMQPSSLGAIRKELKSLNERMNFIEDLVEQVILRDLPKAKMSRRKLTEIKKSVAEIRKGDYATLEELSRT